jgi:hypothetical protein
MRLFSTVLLSVGATLVVGALGRLSFVSAIPSLFFAFLIPCALFFGILFAKYEEDIILLPFAAAGILFSFQSGVTIGVGALMLAFALIGFASAKSNGAISGFRALLVWLAAATVCFLAPWAFSRLFSMAVAAVCGSIVFFVGAFLFQRHLQAGKKQYNK